MELTVRMTESAMVARSAAAGSMVLLKNVRHALPLLPENGEPLPIAVFGAGQIRTALTAGIQPWRSINVLDGLCASDSVVPDGLLAHKYRSFILKAADPAAEIPIPELDIGAAASRARAAVIVVSRPYDGYDYRLRPREMELIQAVSKAFERTVLVLNAPGYLDIAEASPLVASIVYMGLAGQEGGGALADLLTARAVFSGKLADTWPVSPEQFDKAAQQTDLYTGYRYYDSFSKDVLYPFGYGLSYGKPLITAYSVGLDDAVVSVEATIENAGELWPVREVLQVYYSAPDDAVSRPVYALECFAKTGLLQPGESETLRLSFPAADMARFDSLTATWRLDPGYYDIRIGTHCRNTTIAGSIYVPKAIVTLEVKNCMERPSEAIRSRRGAKPFTYPGEAEERAASRKHAIRLSSRQVAARLVRYSKKFPGCRGGREGIRLADVYEGRYDLRQLVAVMTDHDLRALVCNFGSSQSGVPGAWGASADLWEPYGIPSVTICKGCDGVRVTRDVKDEEGDVVRHQYATAFPVPSLLACSFDRELLHSVGSAVGRELREFGADLWLSPSATVHRDPRSSCYHGAFSEDPVAAGLCAAWMIQGCQQHAMAALRHVESTVEVTLTERTLREFELLGFEIAVELGRPKALLAPSIAVCGEALSLDNRILSEVLYDEWGYDGMAFAAGELFSRFPSRPMLELAALRTLRMILDSAAFRKTVR